MGSAGGHKSMARAEVALSNLPSRVKDKDNKVLLNWIIKQIEKRAKK